MLANIPFYILANILLMAGMPCSCTGAFPAKEGGIIDLKRITRCKLALIFTSADHRKFLGLFGSEAARL